MRYEVSYEDHSKRYLVLDTHHDRKQCAEYAEKTTAHDRAREMNFLWQLKFSDIAAI